jgi:membrane-associated phospholipid phosphatase
VSRHQRDRPLLPAPARRPVGLVLTGAALTLAAGALCVRDQYADPLDRWVSSWANGHLSGYSEALRLIADLGQKIQVTVIIAGIVVACLATRRVNGAVLAAVSTPAAAVATEKVLKPLAGHLAPYASYPSGHTTSVFALIATAAVLLAWPARTSGRPALWFAMLATAVLIGCGVCLAVIGLGEHHLIDTVGGAAVGVAVVLTAALVLDLPVSQKLLRVASFSGRMAGDQAEQRPTRAR